MTDEEREATLQSTHDLNIYDATYLLLRQVGVT